ADRIGTEEPGHERSRLLRGPRPHEFVDREPAGVALVQNRSDHRNLLRSPVEPVALLVFRSTVLPHCPCLPSCTVSSRTSSPNSGWRLAGWCATPSAGRPTPRGNSLKGLQSHRQRRILEAEQLVVRESRTKCRTGRRVFKRGVASGCDR